MSFKTYIILAIFTGILLAYVMYMSKEIATSKQKLEAFQEATSRDTKPKLTTSTPDDAPAKPPTVVPTQPAVVVPTQPPTVMPTQPPTAMPTQPAVVVPTQPPPTPSPAPKSSLKQKEDLEKSLFIISKYEEIYGSKIGPEELDQLSAEFANVEDRDVITYKLKELKYKTIEEVDAVFELADVSEKLQSIVQKLKGKAINVLSQNVENKGELKDVEGFFKGPKYTAY